MKGFVLPAQQQDYFFHHVQPGDTITGIISEYFIDKAHGMQSHIQQIMLDNPEITNPDFIKPGQVIVLRTPATDMCLAPIDFKEMDYVKTSWNTLDERTKQAVKATSPWYNRLSLGLAGGGAALFTLENTLSSNMILLNGVPDAYANYKAGTITKSQYDYIRKTRLDQYAKNIGPAIKKLIYGGEKPHKTVRMKLVADPLAATKPVREHMNKLTRISKAASRGGLVLTGVGLAASCYQISQTESRVEKNEIAVATLASTIVGTGAGYAVGVVLAATPITWGVVLAIGVGSVLAGISAGNIAEHLYKMSSTKPDVINSLKIDKVCG